MKRRNKEKRISIINEIIFLKSTFIETLNLIHEKTIKIKIISTNIVLNLLWFCYWYSVFISFQLIF
jgi:hypothetical protein